MKSLGVLVFVFLGSVISFSIASPLRSIATTVEVSPTSSKTEIVMLGTGTPITDPDRSGPSVAIVVNDTPYIVDFGPGVVRRAAAAYRKGIKGLAMPKLTRAFVTHLHS